MGLGRSAEDRKPDISSNEEAALRRYEARIGLWKVVLGTFIVGLAGVLVPGAVSIYTSFTEQLRRSTELKLVREQAHQQYIKEFFDVAINQDIELRIRFAEYFSNLSDPTQKHLWLGYLSALVEQREEKRRAIQELEQKLVEIKKIPVEKRQAAEFDRVVRTLQWLYAEIGYAPIVRSSVSSVEFVERGESPAKHSRKIRAYSEAVEVVSSIQSSLSQGLELDQDSEEIQKFWKIYGDDLIGVESGKFAAVMVKIGEILRSPKEISDAEISRLGVLSEELERLARQELSSKVEVVSSAVARGAKVAGYEWTRDGSCISEWRQILHFNDGSTQLGDCR